MYIFFLNNKMAARSSVGVIEFPFELELGRKKRGERGKARRKEGRGKKRRKEREKGRGRKRRI